MAQAQTSSPLVSVILCTFNRRLVKRALRSMLAQTYPRWELVLVDDGSTDGSSGDLRTFARGDARVRYIRHANRGLAFSRNAGVRLAVGAYVTFLDSDDAYEPDHLARRMRYLLRHSNLDGVYGGIKAID